MIDFVAPTCPTYCICAECQSAAECPLVKIFMEIGCEDFDDGYEGPVNYPDGDAWREYVKCVWGNQCPD